MDKFLIRSSGSSTFKRLIEPNEERHNEEGSAHNDEPRQLRAFKHQRQSISHSLQTYGCESETAYRRCFKVVLDVARFLINQCLDFHGIDEGLDPFNKGNFLELVEWYCMHIDVGAKTMIENAPEVTSPEVQEEIVSAYATEVTNAIINDIGDNIFSLIVDEYEDALEQMGVVLRYVNKQGCILERFLSLVHVHDTSAISLKSAIDELFAKHKLSLSKLRGQGCDGFSNMRGEYNGLKTLILKENSSARYVHCFSHRLHMVVVSVACSNLSVCEFFIYLGKIVNVVSASCERKDMLLKLEHHRILEALENGDIESGRSKIKSSSRMLGDTRWGSHYTTIAHVIIMWSSILEVLENIFDDDSDGNNSLAMILIETMENYKFVFAMLLMKHLLGITSCLSLALQHHHIVLVVSLVKTMKCQLQQFRDNGWEEFLNEVNTFCVNNAIPLDNMEVERRILGRRRQNAEMMTNHNFFRVEIFLQVVDRIIQEMNNRFSEVIMELLTCIACLDPRDTFSKFDIGKLLRLADLYPDDFSLTNRVILEQELGAYINHVKFDDEFSAIENFESLAQMMVQTGRHIVFPLVYRLIELALVLPIATASVKRDFSDMKNIRTDLRNRMGNERLNDVMTLYVEKEISLGIDNEQILQRMQTCRMELSPLVSSSTSSISNIRK